MTLREITDDNRDAIMALRTTTAQEQFVSTVAYSLDEAREHPEGNPWYRAVYDGAEPVGFVMLSWDITPRPPDLNGPWFLWKLLVDQRHQRRGYGSRIVRRVVDIVRENGGTELLTSYSPGDGDPSGFYARLGFVPRGDIDPDGEVILQLDLRS